MRVLKEPRTEKALEKKFLQLLERRLPQAKAIKFNSMYGAGWPDRIVLHPLGQVAFVELKQGQTARKTTALQDQKIALLQKMGFKVYVAKGLSGVEATLAELARFFLNAPL